MIDVNDERDLQMKYSALFGVGALICISAPGAFAATEEVDVTIYGVETQRGEAVALPNGTKVTGGGQTHGTVVNRKTGEVTSQWCSAATFQDGAGNQTSQGGACTAFYDDGTLLHVSYLGAAPDAGNTWTVMGGTGRYAGATGGGSCKNDSMRSDGFAWTASCKGSIVTK
jgi:hypothetical protein